MICPDDFACVTAYFNPVKYVRRRTNYEAFRDALGVPLWTIECAFGDREFELPDDAWTLRVRAPDILWQKERLLNLAFAKLPARISKIAWVDADVQFDNPDWASHASRLLDDFQVVQLFERAVRLPPPGTGEPRTTRGFVARCAERAAPPDAGRCVHGDTGLAWAARRDLLAHTGLYDACIAGGGDHMMAHALHGWQASPCITRSLQGAHYAHYRSWADAHRERVAGRVAYVPGNALHQWHGRREHRQYSDRHQILASFDFDPTQDLANSAGGCWAWAGARPALRAWLVQYFIDRREDDA
ncbi:MAG TPA: hypothetical protein VFK02_20490 [Kofleriaceae bacterium]|nr:hypothetical protein [Kofleriaceae bacterium]